MKRKTKKYFFLGLSLLALFILYTASLTFVDVQPIGPGGSRVGYGGINKAAQQLFGMNMTLYFLTDWAGAAVLLVALGFAVLGAVQWIKRKSVLKVDKHLLLLGLFYLLVLGAYGFFEINVINRRPVLIEGVLEASYPSSITMLSLFIMPTAMMQFHRLIGKYRLRCAINTACGLFTALLVIGRLISGVHWFTDILGGILFSAAMVMLYWAAASLPAGEKERA